MQPLLDKVSQQGAESISRSWLQSCQNSQPSGVGAALAQAMRPSCLAVTDQPAGRRMDTILGPA